MIDRRQLKELTISLSDATAAGIARVGPVDKTAVEVRRRWIADGCHGTMTYLERYDDIRDNPALLFEGARTLIVAAFSYANPDAVAAMDTARVPHIAEYALGPDYHTEIRRRLTIVTDYLTERYGGATRICVDTAPLRERYWATRAGLGYIGLNNHLIIPGHGAHFFLGTILWTGTVADGPDKPCNADCGKCGRCIKACPAGALSADGRLDARRCLSYLTIENRDPLPDGFSTGNRLYGCDTCRRVCPHEKVEPASTIFTPNTALTAMTADDWASLTPSAYKKLTRDSAMTRVRLDKIKDTLRHL